LLDRCIRSDQSGLHWHALIAIMINDCHTCEIYLSQERTLLIYFEFQVLQNKALLNEDMKDGSCQLVGFSIWIPTYFRDQFILLKHHCVQSSENRAM
jgi:hypothetical protein